MRFLWQIVLVVAVAVYLVSARPAVLNPAGRTRNYENCMNMADEEFIKCNAQGNSESSDLQVVVDGCTKLFKNMKKECNDLYGPEMVAED